MLVVRKLFQLALYTYLPVVDLEGISMKPHLKSCFVFSTLATLF